MMMICSGLNKQPSSPPAPREISGRRGKMSLFIKQFPAQLHRELKMEALKQGISLYALVIAILTNYLADQAAIAKAEGGE